MITALTDWYSYSIRNTFECFISARKSWRQIANTSGAISTCSPDIYTNAECSKLMTILYSANVITVENRLTLASSLLLLATLVVQIQHSVWVCLCLCIRRNNFRMKWPLLKYLAL